MDNGTIGASLFIAMGVVSVATAAIFPQDAWGAPPTFPGQMHIILTGVVGLISLFSMLLIGIWFNRAEFFPGFGTYSFITIGAVVLSAEFLDCEPGKSDHGIDRSDHHSRRFPVDIGPCVMDVFKK